MNSKESRIERAKEYLRTNRIIINRSEFQYLCYEPLTAVKVWPQSGSCHDYIESMNGVICEKGYFIIPPENLTMLLLKFRGVQIWDDR